MELAVCYGGYVQTMILTFGKHLAVITNGHPDLTFVQTAVENVNDRNYPFHRLGRLYRRLITQEETST